MRSLHRSGVVCTASQTGGPSDRWGRDIHVYFTSSLGGTGSLLSVGSTFILVIVILTAIAFDFTNGFHDTANAVATSIATGALKPMVAVIMSGCLNFLGAFISISVAATIAKGVVDPSVANSTGGLEIVLAALTGAIIWNLTTWCLSIPSSSSHAIIGGLVGAAVAAVGAPAVSFHGIIEKVVAPAVLAVFICGAVAALGTFAAYVMVRRLGDRQARTGYRYGQSDPPHWCRWPTGPTTRRRRWASSRSR